MIRQCRCILATVVALTALAMLSAPSAHAAKYCGTAAGLHVYSVAVACSSARAYIRVDRCPRGWRRITLWAEFEPQVTGFECRRGAWRFWGTT